MTPHFLIWSFGPKIESVDGICHQTDSMNRFYLDVKTGPKDLPGIMFATYQAGGRIRLLRESASLTDIKMQESLRSFWFWV